jgi:hypothetical protein
MRPRAATMVAWEKWPDGWRIFAEVICCLGMRLFLHGETGRRSAGEWFAPSRAATIEALGM